MFKDNKPAKPQAPKVPDTEDLKDAAVSKTINKADQKINQAKSYAEVAQNSSMKFMNQSMQRNTPMKTDGKLWSNQPTSKIHNASSIPTSQILGINRVVKLEIVVEGKLIPHFKHFSLTQSTIKHHNFSLILAYDTLGNAENHNLEEAQNFLGKRITVVFKYKDVEDSPERNFVGVITEVGFSQEKAALEILCLPATVLRSCWMQPLISRVLEAGSK